MLGDPNEPREIARSVFARRWSLLAWSGVANRPAQLLQRQGLRLSEARAFEGLPNDTPMTALCRTIEIDIRQQLGDRDLPPPFEPVDGVLM